MELYLPDTVKFIAQCLRELLLGNTYVVGGYLRDSLLGIDSNDIDLATSVIPEDIMKLDGYKCDGYRIRAVPTGIDYGTVTLYITHNDITESIEVTTLRKDILCNGRHAQVTYTNDINEDLARRDFAFNALAANITNNQDQAILVDPFDGIGDLIGRTIRTVGDPNNRIQEDYLRMIRACRFTGYYHVNRTFSMSNELQYAITQHSHKLLDNVSRERIRDELMKMMSSARPDKCIDALAYTNLLQHIIPPLDDCIGVDQNKRHNETVYKHCVDVCRFLPRNKPLLRLAGLLHDIGKPATKDSTGADCTFYNHEIQGARAAYLLMRDHLKFPIKDCEYVSTMVRHHMFRFDYDSKRKTIKKWLKNTKGLYKDLFLLRIADRAGNHAKRHLPLITKHMYSLWNKIKEIEEYKEPMRISELNISGNDFIRMGYEPGPQFGIILNTLLERVLDEPLHNTKEKLTQMAKELFETA